MFHNRFSSTLTSAFLTPIMFGVRERISVSAFTLRCTAERTNLDQSRKPSCRASFPTSVPTKASRKKPTHNRANGNSRERKWIKESRKKWSSLVRRWYETWNQRERVPWANKKEWNGNDRPEVPIMSIHLPFTLFLVLYHHRLCKSFLLLLLNGRAEANNCTNEIQLGREGREQLIKLKPSWRVVCVAHICTKLDSNSRIMKQNVHVKEFSTQLNQSVIIAMSTASCKREFKNKFDSLIQ